MITVKEYVEGKWLKDIEEQGYVMPGPKLVMRWVKRYTELVIDECANEVREEPWQITKEAVLAVKDIL